MTTPTGHPSQPDLCPVTSNSIKPTLCLIKGWTTTNLIALSLGGAGMTAVGEPSPKERLAAFIESPPPIQEMVVECNWYAARQTNTYWIVLSWQTNAYVLRKSRERTSVFDLFTTNKDELITIRSGDNYWAVSWYKFLGVYTTHINLADHSARVSSAEKALERSRDPDKEMPQNRGQEAFVEVALAVGLPVPAGSIRLKHGGFTYHNEKAGTTLSGVMEIDRGNVPTGFALTNVVAPVADRKGAVVPIRLRYAYGGTAGPLWFPREIERDVTIGGRTLTHCRLVVHRLELGTVPQAEFSPDRFLRQ